jgi:hypothetical protein
MLQPAATACSGVEPSQKHLNDWRDDTSCLRRAARCDQASLLLQITSGQLLHSCRSYSAHNGSASCGLRYMQVQKAQQGLRRRRCHPAARRSSQAHSNASACCAACSYCTAYPCSRARSSYTAEKIYTAQHHGNLQDRRAVLLHLRPHRPGERVSMGCQQTCMMRSQFPHHALCDVLACTPAHAPTSH